MKTWIALALAALLAAAAIACELEEEGESGPALTGSTSNATATPRAGFAKVGSLEIQILSIDAFDSTSYNMFNEENLRIHVQVRKVKGDEYDFTLNEWILVTARGTGFDHSMFCADCPDAIGNLVLYGDGWIEAYVYFEIPPGTHSFTEVRYEPLVSTNKAKIPLSFTATVN